MKIILIPDRVNETKIENKVFGDDYKLVIPNVLSLSEITDDLWSTCDGMLVWHDLTIPKILFQSYRNVRELSGWVPV